MGGDNTTPCMVCHPTPGHPGALCPPHSRQVIATYTLESRPYNTWPSWPVAHPNRHGPQPPAGHFPDLPH